MKIESPELIAALNAANDLREAFDEETLVDLPNGRAGASKSCILAKAFNFKCAVHPRGFGHWAVTFSKQYQDQANKLASILETECKELFYGDDYYEYIVYLPREIALVAEMFDAGRLRQYEGSPYG